MSQRPEEVDEEAVAGDSEVDSVEVEADQEEVMEVQDQWAEVEWAEDEEDKQLGKIFETKSL